MAQLVIEHGWHMAEVGTGLMLSHVTWRTLPDEHRHSFRRGFRHVRKVVEGKFRRR